MILTQGAVREEDVTFSATGHNHSGGADGENVPEAGVVFSATGHTHTGGADGENIPTGGIVDSAVTLVKIATPRGALVRKTANQSIPDITSTALTWDAEEYDTDAIHDNATNNSRLTVPAGVTRVRLSAKVQWGNVAAGYRQVFIRKAGATFIGQPETIYDIDSAIYHQTDISSPPIVVVAGDYFEVLVYQNSGAALNVIGLDGSWFAMELIK